MINFKHLHYFHAVAKAGAVNRAAEKLHLAPQTLSGQLTQFEDRLGVALFRRNGRRLELTETGRVVLAYTDELFQLSAELEEVLRGNPEERALPFRVGIADVVPKSIAHRLLAPTLALPEPVRLVCREDNLDRLLAELAIHRLDMVLADRPLPPGMDVKGYSHPLGECSVAFFAAPELAGQRLARTADALAGAPERAPAHRRRIRRQRLDAGVWSGRGRGFSCAFGQPPRHGNPVRHAHARRNAGDPGTLFPDFGGTPDRPSCRARGQRRRARRAVRRIDAARRQAGSPNRQPYQIAMFASACDETRCVLFTPRQSCRIEKRLNHEIHAHHPKRSYPACRVRRERIR
jgi:DNA-binding transcriptional LysR family regulator